MKISEIKNILKQNNIKGWAHLNKPDLIGLLKENNLMPDEPPKPPKSTKTCIDPKNQKLYEARNNPNTVIFKDIITKEEIIILV